jgi:cyclophilin family peptidyl-prolyl cis-trans isomerase
MSATPPSVLEGTQSPSQIELLWERYRSLAYVIIFAVVAALGVNYAIKYFDRKKTDENWSAFTATLGYEKGYTDDAKAFTSLTDLLKDVDLATIEASLGKALPAQKPFLLMAVARRAIIEKQWDRAESALKDLETNYPQHSLVKASKYPIQTREEVKKDQKKDEVVPVQQKPKKPEWKPAVEGSAVALVRQQIAAAKGYAAPTQFAKAEVPADATKIKFELSEGFGSFVIALMPQAEKHREAFIKLAKEGFWKDVAVDEIRRSAKFMKQPLELHLGFKSTTVDDRTKWNTTEPSTNLLDFESTNLSHFAGAVSARNEADGKSCSDRFWICVDDNPSHDGERVVFGFVVEGLDNLRRVCEAAMSTQEEERGSGRPSANIRVSAVTVQ